MSKIHHEITPRLMTFIERQKIFFVATAADQGRVNISPKGLDSLHIIDSQRLAWLNLTGSGNETSAHVQQNPRMTLMFCAFDGEPLILRLYGTAREVTSADLQWDELAGLFTDIPGRRQVFDMTVDLVVTSCGFGVPLYNYDGDRDALIKWAEKKGDHGIRKYWEKNNQFSLDNYPTGIISGETGD
jgi:hypothetical protein